jgi:hypothetical protein
VILKTQASRNPRPDRRGAAPPQPAHHDGKSTADEDADDGGDASSRLGDELVRITTTVPPDIDPLCAALPRIVSRPDSPASASKAQHALTGAGTQCPQRAFRPQLPGNSDWPPRSVTTSARGVA